MKNIGIGVVSAFLLVACVHGQAPRPQAHLNEVLLTRAFLSNQPCPSDPGGEQEDALSAALSWVISKGAETVVNYVANAVGDAAREDRETYTLTGQSTDYLYQIAADEPTLRQCLYVVVAPTGQSGEFCPEAGGNWFNARACNVQVDEISRRWREWRLGEPKLYAEIGLVVPRDGPNTALKPTIYRLYYPEPISGIPVSKVKGLTLMVSAAKPVRANRTSGDIVLEIFIGGDGLTPSAVIGPSTPWRDGLWTTVPSIEGVLGSAFAVPVNLTVTVAETPNPTPWLQAIAKYVEANKQKAVSAIVDRLDPGIREDKAENEVVSNLTLQASAAESCVQLSARMAEVQAKAVDYGSFSGDEEGKLARRYALDSACVAARLQIRSSRGAWNLAGHSAALCHRTNGPDDIINGVCT